MPVSQSTPSIPYLRGHHVALRKEVAAQAVGQLAGVDLVVLLLGRCNRTQHQRVSHLDLRGVRKQVIVDPAAEDRRLQAILPGPPVISTNHSNWKKQVREALDGHKLHVAFDAVGGSAIDDLAELLDFDGTVINFGSLENNTGTNIYSLAPNNLALKSVSILDWVRLPEDEKRRDFELALNLAIKHPQLFEVAYEYEFDDFQRAIQHVSRPGKTGIVLLKSQA
jgi:NADPH:quinone reductase-like Zn-dependent oxidoreductase